MDEKDVCTEKAWKAVVTYSQTVEHNGTIYLSGVTAVDPEKGVPTGSVEEQAERILNTIATILEAGGSSMDKVLSRAQTGCLHGVSGLLGMAHPSQRKSLRLHTGSLLYCLSA